MARNRPLKSLVNKKRVTVKRKSNVRPPLHPRPSKPEPEPELTWPKSRLIASTTITASDCRLFYRLTSSDIAPLKFTVKPSTNNRPMPMHLYSELEVERTTWRKHGGPARWLWYLDNLRASYLKRHPNGVFKEPSRRNSRTRRADRRPSAKLHFPGGPLSDLAVVWRSDRVLDLGISRLGNPKTG
ncbi:hypothetical protein BV25DRAFT_1917308 [Artomyces pyxidatus]|uniref:Uncharacterized protein n=1 Tax=Artomyces pyxidatus TaxID=48021 RepID=A0ACB8SXV2_9AGAM|nr:hypothetical protein BV25DRAFT_1917308 [Artomyces pyxidatus]